MAFHGLTLWPWPEASQSPARSLQGWGVEAQQEQGSECSAEVMAKVAGASYLVLEGK